MSLRFKGAVDSLIMQAIVEYKNVEPHFMYMITNEIMFDDRVMSRKDFLIFFKCIISLFRESKHAKAQALSKQGQEKQR